MARRRRSNSGSCGLIILEFTVVFGVVGFLLGIIALAISAIAGALSAVINFVQENAIIIAMVFAVIVTGFIIGVIIIKRIQKQRDELLTEILEYLNLRNIDSLLKEYDDQITVKSKQELDNYDDIKYLKETGKLDSIRDIMDMKENIMRDISSFLKQNEFVEMPQYKFVANQLNGYLSLADSYRVRIIYITSAGISKGEKTLHLSSSLIRGIEEQLRLSSPSPSRKIEEQSRFSFPPSGRIIGERPVKAMTRAEYNKLIKQQEKEKIEKKKLDYYGRVNVIIDHANDSKDGLIVKNREKELEKLVQQLSDRARTDIYKIKRLDSVEWVIFDKFITDIANQVDTILRDDKRISDYYRSNEFAQIKETCKSLNESRKEFNEYIEEKAQSISKMFGTRIVRNETKHEDSYNYIRVYKKSITPFTAEVSSTVFGSAENNPIDYVIKYFYPNKNKYKEQIQKLKVLIEELETLKEAKIIIDSYKKDYDQYIKNVPAYVLEEDEDGFYQRLGLAIIDEAVLNVEYKFIYTSDGGKAQRSFTVPMNEETIIELINRLENKLSIQAQTKEQRALMTSKLRAYIKQRDNYTCCQCGNSIHKEPNLLLEVDHIIPIAKGGFTLENNLQTLCWKCNRRKGTKLVV